MSRPPKDSKLSKKEIGARVRALRNQRDITQVDLATALGLTQSNVSAMERGDRGVTIHQAVKLARILGATVDELLTGVKTAGAGDVRRHDRRFWRRLDQIEGLPKRKKQALLTTLDDFLKGAAPQ